MLSLLTNENVKIFRRSRSWFFVGVVMLAVIAICLVVYHSSGGRQGQKVWAFLSDVSSLMTLITIFVAVVAGDSVANEFSTGTIKLLLIRPKSRTEVLWSKYIAILIYATLLVLFLFVFSFLLGGLVFGFDDAKKPFTFLHVNQVTQMPLYLHVLRSYAFSLVPLVMTVTVSFVISTLFRSSSLAISLSILLIVFGNLIVELLSRYHWDKFILFANENLLMYYEGQPIVKGMTIAFSIVMLIVYFIVFHVVAWFAFARRDVAA